MTGFVISGAEPSNYANTLCNKRVYFNYTFKTPFKLNRRHGTRKQ